VGVGAESSYGVSALRAQVRATAGVSLRTRLRLAAAWSDPAPPRAPRHQGRPGKKGARRPPWPQRLTDPQTQWTAVTVTTW
jgi:hypothetical protein